MNTKKLLKGMLLASMVLLWTSAGYGEEKKLSDVAELSYVNTGGNTDVTSLSFNNALKYLPSEKTSVLWKISHLQAKTEGVVTARKYSSDLRGDYKLSDKSYTYGIASWLKDKFAGLDSRYSLGAGAGYHLLNGPKHLLDGEAGLNWSKEERTDGTDDDYPGGRLFASYGYNFNDKNKFLQTAEYLHDFDDSDNYLANSETSVISALNGNLSLKTSYVVKYDNKPAAGKKDTDTALTVTLVVNM